MARRVRHQVCVLRYHRLILGIRLYKVIILNINHMHKVLLLAAIALAGSVSARLSPGQCDYPALQENFDKAKYGGIWF